VTLRVTIHDLAIGGDGVGRLVDGRVVFVPGTAVGDEVEIELTEEKKRFTRGRILKIAKAGPGRREPPCSEVTKGCGGCNWQHLTEDEQIQRKQGMVDGALRRIAKLDPPELSTVRLPSSSGYRTTLRVGILDGEPAFRARSTNDLIPIHRCDVAHALFDDMLGEGAFGRADEAVLRVASRTGERLAVVDPSLKGVELAPDVLLLSTNEIESGKMAILVEMAAGRPWQISADSFFQSSPEGAELLVDAIDEWLSGQDFAIDHLLDLYGGVGLFSGTIGDRFERVTLVDSGQSATEDAEMNLDDDRCEIVHSSVERFRPVPADVVIADPPRAGLKAKGVQKIVDTGAGVVVLVSCDAGSLGRDAGLMDQAGYSLDTVVLADLFPQTSHVEVVTGWVKRGL